MSSVGKLVDDRIQELYRILDSKEFSTGEWLRLFYPTVVTLRAIKKISNE